MRALSCAVSTALLWVAACGGTGTPPAPGGATGGQPDAGSPAAGGPPSGAPDAGSPPAPPPPTRYVLTISASGPGAVRSPLLAAPCRDSCRLELPAGATVHLEAAPDDKGELSAWSGVCSGASGCDLTLSSDAAVWAAFRERQVSLAIAVDGAGSVRSTPAGLDCSGTCSATFAAGTRVRLEAIPADGYAFSGFGGACNGTSCEVEVMQAKTVSASFRQIFDTLTVRVHGDGRGNVVSIPPGIDCPSGQTCSAPFPRNAAVKLVATPDAISRVSSWTGLCAAEPCALKMGGSGAIDVSFANRRYRVVDLGTLPGDWWSAASAISATGEIVAGVSGGNNRPVIFGATPQALGPSDGGFVAGVNSHRVAAGTYFSTSVDANGNRIWKPFRWADGVLTDLPFFPGGTYGWATGMNERGIIIGYASYTNGPTRAVYWNDSGINDLGSAGDGYYACSMALGINNQGVVAGETCTRSGRVHAARFRGAGVVDDLGTLGGSYSRATGINDRGDIVGFSDMPQGDGVHGFIWRNGTMLDAGALPGHLQSQLQSVNSQGVAVGMSYNPNQWPSAAVLYVDGRLVAIADLITDVRSIQITSVGAIDENNVIAGQATIFGSQRAVLLGPP